MTVREVIGVTIVIELEVWTVVVRSIVSAVSSEEESVKVSTVNYCDCKS